MLKEAQESLRDGLGERISWDSETQKRMGNDRSSEKLSISKKVCEMLKLDTEMLEKLKKWD